MVFAENTGLPNVRFGRVDCKCSTDGDDEGVLPCNGGDCDDSDPEVARGRTEICDDGKDNDCDTLADCNDPDCAESGFPPEEIAGLRFEADGQTLLWDATPLTDGYDLARGKAGDLLAMGSFAWGECLASNIATTTGTDVQTPPFGNAYYYRVRGRRPTRLVASWGTPLRDDTLTGCP
ncbi:MAG: putative metal-binding motif-containing protein [Acidobacteriota bacterium]|nr:putative metal-binding motif-containing protein [Acidobacteriota bacterium]